MLSWVSDSLLYTSHKSHLNLTTAIEVGTVSIPTFQAYREPKQPVQSDTAGK